MSWRPGRRFARVAFAAAGAVVALVAVVFSGAAWYFAGQLEEAGLQASPSEDRPDLVVTARGPSWIELRPTSAGSKEWRRDGTYRLVWDGQAAPIGRIVESRENVVRRAFEPIGDNGPAVGTAVRLDAFAFGEDPLESHGIEFEDTTVGGELGPMPAWLIPGETERWVIMVHGRGSRRQEALRALPAIHRAGPTILVITYRNDEGAPASPDGRYGFGSTEWRDLEAAAVFAREHGAKDLLLVGYSMGGAIVVSFMVHSPQESPAVGAIVLDAPMLSFSSSVDLAASHRHLPGLLTALAKTVASIRFSIHWDDMDFRDEAAALEVPILLFHGSEDDRTPVGDSDRLADGRPDIVTYERFEGAAHVRSWNVDPERYESALEQFVETWMKRSSLRQASSALSPPSWR